MFRLKKIRVYSNGSEQDVDIVNSYLKDAVSVETLTGYVDLEHTQKYIEYCIIVDIKEDGDDN